MPFTQKPIRVRSQDNKANVKDEKVEKSCPARMMLLLSLLKHLVPSYPYLEIDKISQAIVPLKFKGPKCWKIHFLVFRFQISSMERGVGGGHTHASSPPLQRTGLHTSNASSEPQNPNFKNTSCLKSLCPVSFSRPATALCMEFLRRRRQRGSLKRRHRFWVQYIFEEQQRLQHSQYQIIL